MRKGEQPQQAKLIDNPQIISQSQGFKKGKYKPYTLYIPENLQIDDLLIKYPPRYKRIPRRYRNYRDSIIYILHLINSIPSSQKDFDFEKHTGFTPIHKEFLRNRVHEYRYYIDYLKEHQIIEEGSSYIVGQRSMGLKFAQQYITKVKSVKIYSLTLIKSIVTGLHNRDIEAEEKLYFLKKWFNTNLTINLVPALDFLEADKIDSRIKITKKRNERDYSEGRLKKLPSIEEIVTMGYNSKFITVDRLNNADFRGYPKIDKTTGRLHSPLTQLKKELRKHLRYAGEKLENIDIVNSQPLLALIILDISIFEKMKIGQLIAKYNPLYKYQEYYNEKDQSKYIKHTQYYTMLVKMIKLNSLKKDVIQFKEAVINGRFYETFSTILQEKNLIPQEILSLPDPEKRQKEIRKFVKIATFRAFFEKVNAIRWCGYVNAFNSCFPNVYAIFQQVKKGKGNHNTLACIFQRFESWLILHEVCVDIHNKHPYIPLFTIHDSITTTTEYSDIVKGFFQKHLKEVLGVDPQLNCEIWEYKGAR